MSGDKDIEGQIPEGQGPHETEADMPVSEAPPPLDEQEAPAPDDFEETDLADDGDFVEEDWESYDEEYADGDDDDDGGAAARGAKFNKIVIGITVVIAVGFGGFTMFSGEKEDMGFPTVQQTGEAIQVSPDQKVEFHTETKIKSKDNFGVAYGENVVAKPEEAEEAAPPTGIFNDPEALAKIRSQSLEARGYYEEAPEGQMREERLPMPSPIAQTGNQETQPGLIPMPRDQEFEQSNAVDSSGTTPSIDLPKARDITLKKTPPQEQQAASSTSNNATLKLDMIIDQLENIEASLSQMERRITKLEKTPRKAATSTKSSRSSQKSSSTAATPPANKKQASKANSDKKWVLKSAQPNQAMVAKQGESDMVRISVGETLSGIGRITAIDMQNGQWIVQGTKGSITQ